jgi:cytochrome c-type biogenesis protein CcmH/NrfG
MSKDELPGFEHIRRLLYSKEVDVEEVRTAAHALAEAERHDDALDLYERLVRDKNDQAGGTERVRGICAKAFSEGDVGVWMKARRILKEPIKPEEWQQIGAIALSLGKQSFALFAYQRSGDQAKVEELCQTLAGKTNAPQGDAQKQ